MRVRKISAGYIKVLVLLSLLYSQVTILQASEKWRINGSETIITRGYEIALAFEGVREATGKNDGYWQRRFQKSVGISAGSPYCYAFQYFCMDSARRELGLEEAQMPLPKTGLANAFLDYASKRGQKVEYRAKRYNFLLWRFEKRYWSKGHIAGILEVSNGGNIITIEANTRCGSQGNEREGDGICQKKRNYKHPLGRMKYKAIIEVKG